MPNDLEIETKIALGADSTDLDVKQLGEVSEFTCPDCHGSLVEVTNDKLLRSTVIPGTALATRAS